MTSLAAAVRGGFGVGDLSDIDKTGDGWEDLSLAKARHSISDLLSVLPEPLFLVVTLALRCRPTVIKEKCTSCGLCAKACPRKAFHRRGGSLAVDGGRCVLCMCCMEACPNKALELLSPVRRITRMFSRAFGRI